MSRAILLIVDGYLRLGDREALDRLLIHRQRMLESMKNLSGLDLSRTMSDLEDEIEIIGRALSEMAPDAGPKPA